MTKITCTLALLLASSGMVGTARAKAPAALPFEEVEKAQFGVVPGMNSMSNSWADFDKDGDLDLAVSQKNGEVRLYRNDGGRFVSIGAAMGLPQKGDYEIRGVSWGDYDGDRLVDLFVTTYVGAPGQQEPKDELLHNEGARGFVDVLAGGGAINLADHGVQWVDYDRDGGLDLSITDNYGPTGGHPLFRNTLPAERKRSLSVLVTDAKGHLTRAGSEVRLYDTGGRIIATRQVSTGDGYNSQNAAPVIFGLTSLAPVRVEVTFMGKGGRRVQTVRNVRPAAYAGKSLVVKQAK